MRLGEKGSEKHTPLQQGEKAASWGHPEVTGKAFAAEEAVGRKPSKHMEGQPSSGLPYVL